MRGGLARPRRKTGATATRSRREDSALGTLCLCCVGRVRRGAESGASDRAWGGAEVSIYFSAIGHLSARCGTTCEWSSRWAVCMTAVGVSVLVEFYGRVTATTCLVTRL